MNKGVISTFIILILLCSVLPTSEGSSNGKFNSASGCGSNSSCHGPSGGATVSMSGHPSSYTAGQTYTLSISVTGPSGNNGGFSLEVNKGQLSTGGIGIMAVKVNSAGTSATHTTNSYRSWSVDWTAPSSGSGTVTFDVAGNAVNGMNGADNGDEWDTATYQVQEAGGSQPNNPPTATNLQLSPANPVTTDTLFLSYTYDDQDNDTELDSQIHWFRDNVHITALDDSMTVSPTFTTKGESWYAEVTPSDGEDSGTMKTSPTLTVINSMPVIESASINPSSATEDDNLSIIMTSSDADGDSRSISGIEWYLDGSKVSAFDGDSEIPSVAIRSGDVWHSRIKVNDGEVDSNWFTTLSITIGSNNQPPVIDSVSIQGTFTTVDDLVATAAASDPNQDTISLEWQWPGSTITTDTLPSYLTSKGESWKVMVRATDGALYSDWVESNSVIIQNSQPELITMNIDQETIFFQSEATYTYEAYDADGDTLIPVETWSLDEDELTLSLKVRDTEFSNSNDLSDTVIIINSPPTVSYSGPTIQTALQDLSPIVETGDANNDDVTTSWEWYRNGFLTSFESNFVPSSSIAAGDIWLAHVTPNDGIENGTVIEIYFSISNINPTALISTQDDLVRGMMVTFSAMDSTDEDGSIVNAIWSIDGVTVHQGLTYSFIMPDSIELEAKVFDDMGASDTYESTYSSQEPPLAVDLQIEIDGTEVALSWKGNAEMWAVAHNGEVVATTSENEYRYSPSLSGSHTFSVYPIVDNQQITIDSATSFGDVDLDAGTIPDAPGPSESLGLIFSIILMLIGIGGVSYSFIQRRD